MRHFVTSVLLTIALSTCGWSQQISDAEKATWRTGERWNGRYWRALDYPTKASFLTGYAEALKASYLSVIDANSKQILAKIWPASLTVGEVMTSLDSIYETPENRPIPVADIITHVITVRTAGVDEPSIQKEINRLRAEASRK